MAEQGQMAKTMAEETSKLVERAASARDDAKTAQAEALFGPGYAQPGAPGLAGREGMPRQWAYGASYNVAQRPRGTEQTSFEQLRNLAALYDGIQFWTRALMKVTPGVKTNRLLLRASDAPAVP
jgi:hypothetical protein